MDQGNYEYTLKTWLKKCQDADCTNLVGTSFFQNTRFEYDWATAGITPMTQTIELSNTATPPPGQLDFLHDRFDRFLFGFTSASTELTNHRDPKIPTQLYPPQRSGGERLASQLRARAGRILYFS